VQVSGPLGEDTECCDGGEIGSGIQRHCYALAIAASIERNDIPAGDISTKKHNHRSRAGAGERRIVTCFISMRRTYSMTRLSLDEAGLPNSSRGGRLVRRQWGS
jgi:hypothetical protein